MSYVGQSVPRVDARAKVKGEARGLGEVMNMCLAPAVTAAVHAATGVWFDEFPLTVERMLRKLEKF